MKRMIFALAVVGLTLVTASAQTVLAASKTNQIRIEYVSPKNSKHQRIYKTLKQRGSLEKLQKLLSPFRLPRPLKLSLAGCDGQVDAFYGDDAITICYELIDDLWEARTDKTRVAGVAPLDTVIGPLFDTTLHEFAHALFDMLELPVLGPEEAAADMVAAYIYLQLGESEARRLVIGTVYAFKRDVDDFKAPTLKDFSSEHGTPAQRGYNLLCIAYGADKKLFGDFVAKGYLPKRRAARCEEEYEKVQDAFEKLIAPHIDRGLAEKVLDRSWLPKKTMRNWLPEKSGRR